MLSRAFDLFSLTQGSPQVNTKPQTKRIKRAETG